MLSELPRAVQKAIVGQWIFYEVLEGHRAMLLDAGEEAVWDGLAGRVRERVLPARRDRHSGADLEWGHI